MKFQTDRKWLFFLFITLFSLWFSGYVQREVNSFRAARALGFYDFRVYYVSGLVARSDTDRRLYAYQEVENPNDSSREKIVLNPQFQPFNPDSTYGNFADQLGNVVGQYIYPPFFSLTIVPFTYLPYERAEILWHTLVFLLACASVVLTVTFLYRDWLTIAIISGVAILIMEFTHPMRDLLDVCNVGSLVLFLTVIGIRLHKKYPAFGALFLAIAVMIKLTPIVILPLMIIRKQWRWLTAFCVWSLLLFGISVWQLGWQNHRDFAMRVMPAMSDGIPLLQNKSLSTVFYAAGAGKFITEEEVLAGDILFAPKMPAMLFKITAAISLCALLFFFWKNNKTDSTIHIEILIFTLWSLLFAPVSFRHYYILALAPIIFVWLHPFTKTASMLQLTMLSAATFMVFSVLPNYVISVTSWFPAQVSLFLIMPVGVVLCIWYSMTLLKSQKESLSESY